MRELVERAVDATGVTDREPTRRDRAAAVNLRESPLAWLRARKLVTARQHAAGEQLRCDYERASLPPGITMRWEAAPGGGKRRGPPEGQDPTTAQLSAKRRFDGALTAAGPGLEDVLWRVVCAGEGVPTAEKALGWPARSGRLVLALALDRVARFYGVA